MLVHRLRRWPNIAPALGQCLVFAGIAILLRAARIGLREVGVPRCHPPITAHVPCNRRIYYAITTARISRVLGVTASLPLIPHYSIYNDVTHTHTPPPPAPSR